MTLEDEVNLWPYKLIIFRLNALELSLISTSAFIKDNQLNISVQLIYYVNKQQLYTHTHIHFKNEERMNWIDEWNLDKNAGALNPGNKICRKNIPWIP